MDKKMIDIIVPVFNEADNISLFRTAIEKTFAPLKYNYTIYFIDDGSIDESLKIIKDFSMSYNNIKYITFSRNFGKDAAIQAGLKYSKGDACIMIDADLQHPVELIPEMIHYWENDYDTIYAFRDKANEHVSFAHQMSASFFYKTLILLSDIEIENGATDYRLTDRKVIDVLNNFSENDPYFRGLTKWIGFKQKAIPYTPNKRLHGTTKYSKRALLKLALRGITSFSVKPLNIATYLGFTFSILSLLYIPYILYSLWFGHPISGWASVIATVVFFGGLQLMILGIIGLYLGKLFMNSKHRPHFIISEENAS